MTELLFRRMQPADLPALERHCRAQNRRDGTSYGVPPVFSATGELEPNVALAVVAVDERGRIRAGYVFERTLEMMGFGGGQEVTDQALEGVPGLLYELRAMGYKTLHVQTPRSHAAELEEPLRQRMGMTRDDHRLAHFYREF